MFRVDSSMSLIGSWGTHLAALLFSLIICCLHFTFAYDPNDTKIESVLPPEGMFEAFYPREIEGVPNSASRPPHAHGSFFKYRNPALVDTKNAAAYGFRFDGKRRFNFD